MQERGCLLLIHHNYEHNHKYKLEIAADLKPPLAFLLLQTWSDGEGKGCTTGCQLQACCCISQHSHAEPGICSSTGICWDAVPELETSPGVSGGIKCSGEAASPGAGVLGGAVGWEEFPAPPSAVGCAQHITGQPSLPRGQISELVNQSFLCCHSRKTFLGACFRRRGITPLPEIFTSFLNSQKVPVKGREQTGTLVPSAIAQRVFQASPGPAGLNRMHPNFLVQW